jgi:hypothetical protein
MVLWKSSPTFHQVMNSLNTILFDRGVGVLGQERIRDVKVQKEEDDKRRQRTRSGRFQSECQLSS